MNIFYHIVPRGDGYHYLCRNKANEFYLASKNTDGKSDTKLMFNTAAEAQDFIDKHFEKDLYIPEGYGQVYRFYCPECERLLTIEGVYNDSCGIVNFICSCENENCLMDWVVTTTSSGKFYEIKRFFHG